MQHSKNADSVKMIKIHHFRPTSPNWNCLTVKREQNFPAKLLIVAWYDYSKSQNVCINALKAAAKIKVDIFSLNRMASTYCTRKLLNLPLWLSGRSLKQRLTIHTIYPYSTKQRSKYARSVVKGPYHVYASPLSAHFIDFSILCNNFSERLLYSWLSKNLFLCVFGGVGVGGGSEGIVAYEYKSRFN